MGVTRRRAAIVIAVSAAVVVAVAARLAVEGTRDASSVDFASAYVGGLIVRHGETAHLYDATLQLRLFRSVMGPGVRWDLPFINPPAAAVLVVPLTWLPFDAAYRIWGFLQLAALAGAVVIAARAAPWRPGTPRQVRVAATVAGMAGIATVMLLAEGQWDGLLALGVALAYAAWRGGRRAAGGAALALAIGIVKPQFGLVLAALLLAWRDRRVLAGAAGGVAVAAFASFVVVGAGGVGGFLARMSAEVAQSTAPMFIGASGLAASWLGPGTAAHVIGWLGTAAAIGAALVLGRRVRSGAATLETAFAAALVLAVLGAPHVYVHDLVILAPALVWCLGAATVRSARWPGAAGGRLLIAWIALNAAAAVDTSAGGVGPPGRLSPWVLIALGAAALASTRPGPGGPERALHARTRQPVTLAG